MAERVRDIVRVAFAGSMTFYCGRLARQSATFAVAGHGPFDNS
jgi:hypothetical protein